MKTLSKISLLAVLTLAVLDCRSMEYSRYAEISDDYFLQYQAQPVEETQQSQPFMAIMALSAAPAAIITSQYPEIQSIANALNNNAEDIILWVKNNIKFEPYNGLVRGARITAIDRAGNSFDIAALTVAILRAAKHTSAGCVFVQKTLTLQEASDWLGIHQDFVESYLKGACCNYPQNVVSANQSSVTFPHVMVQVNGKLYDPSIKPYWRYTAASYTPDLAEIFSKMGGNDLPTNVSGVLVPTYKGDPTKMQSFKTYLSEQASILQSRILSNIDPNVAYDYSGLQAIGGREINKQGSLASENYLPPIENWPDGNIPTKYNATLTVSVGTISGTFSLPDIEAGKISIRF